MIQFKYFKIIALVFIILGKCLAIDIYIPDGTYKIYNLTEIIKKYSVKSNVINVHLTDEYFESDLRYQMGLQIDIPENVDFSLYGKENHGTEVKLGKNGFYYSINFEKYTGQKITFENIKFVDMQDPSQLNSIFYTRSSSSNFSILFKNCTYEGGNGRFIIIDPENNHIIKNDNNDIQVKFDSCKFKDISGTGVLQFANKDQESLDHPFRFSIINSEFYNCDGVTKVSFGTVEYDNCKFSKISAASEKASFAYLKTHGKLNVKNSSFIDFEADDSIVPFIKSSGNLIEFQNVTMINVQNKVGHLIYDIADGTKYENKIYISNSYFKNINPLINAENIEVYIDNSTFEDIENKNYIGTISGTKYSKNHISNTTIRGVKLYGTSLFDEQSSLYLNNVTIENISTLYKSIIQIYYKDIEFQNVNINNINVLGEKNECYLMAIKANLEGKPILFNDVTISNTFSNGNMMYVEGDIINMEWNQSNISNSTSNGAFLQTQSENTSIKFSSFKFINNENESKTDCGLITMENNIYLNITDSEFSDNKSYSTGVFYLNNTKNTNISIRNSNFISNSCHSKGTIMYLIDDPNENNYQKSFTSIKSNYKFNKATNFGGVFITSINNEYNLDIRENEFLNNTVNVAGAVFFFENINERIPIIYNYLTNNNNNNLFEGNKANSHGPIVATHPSYFEFGVPDDVIDKKNYEIKTKDDILSGETISFTITLKDELNNLVEDLEKFYSDIGITKELYYYDINEKVANYSITVQDSIFYMGKNNIKYLKVLCQEPGTYNLRIKAKKNSYNILENVQLDYKLIIKNCNDDQIKVIDKNNLFLCEYPKCSDDCSGNKRCIKPDDAPENVNDPKYNKCICNTGKKGINCEENDFGPENDSKNTNRILTITSELIMVAVTIYIFSNSNMNVVKDLGVYSFLFIALGCMIKNFSNFYVITDSKLNCFLHLFISSLGFMMIFAPFTIKLIIASSFAIKFNTGKIDYILMNNIFTTQICESMFFSDKTKSTSQVDGNNPNQTSKLLLSSRKLGDSLEYLPRNSRTISNDFMFGNNTSQTLPGTPNLNIYSSQTIPTIASGNNNPSNTQYDSQTLPTEKVDESTLPKPKKIKKHKKKSKFERIMRLCYYSIITLYIVFFIYLIPPAMYGVKIYDKELIESFMINNYYHHVCPANHMVFIMTVAQLIFLGYDIEKYQWISNGRYIFVDSKIIGIICMIWIFIDPGLNVILYTLFKDNMGAAQSIQFYSNLISCLFIFFGYFSYIIYLIYTKKGNYRYNYFINIPKAKCIIHNSYVCPCAGKKVELYDEDELESINQYVTFYKQYFNLETFKRVFKNIFKK